MGKAAMSNFTKHSSSWLTFAAIAASMVTAPASAETISEQTIFSLSQAPAIAPAPSLPLQLSQATELDLLDRMEQRLLQLEQRQQELLEEIDQLKAQLQDPASVTPVEVELAETEPAELTAEEIKLTRSSRAQGLYLSGEVLFLQPTPGDKLDFAITDPGEALTTSGDVESVEYGNQPDTRIGVGYRQGNVDARLTWLKIENDSSATAERSEDGFLFSTLTHPAQNDSAETAEADASLTYTTTDLEVGYSLAANDRLDLRLFTGLRFADTDQRLKVAYDGVDFTDATLELDHSFAGFGPKLGADLRWQVGAGFSLFSRATGALLMGDSRTTYEETDNSGETIVAELKQRENDRIIPVAEMALGIDWSQQVTDNIGLGITVGYEYQNWFNAYNNVQFLDNASPGVFTDSDEDMGFQGFFVRSGLSLNF